MKDRKLTALEMGRLTPDEYRNRKEEGIVVVLDNVRSAYNVGSAFRSGDGFGIDKLYLCGICAVPPSAEIHKTALGAEQSVPWEHRDDTLELLRELRAQGYTIVSVEQTVGSVKMPDFVGREGRFAFIFGNEVDGVQQSVVDESDYALEIQQRGTKHSLNVAVSVGIVLFAATFPVR